MSARTWMALLLWTCPGCGARVTPPRDPDAGADGGGREASHDAGRVAIDGGLDAGVEPFDDELSPEDAVCAIPSPPARPPDCWAWDSAGWGVQFSDPQLLEEAGVAVALHGRRGYVCFEDGRLAVIDLSNEAAPVTRGTVALPGEPRDLQVAGRWVWVAGGSAGLLGVDVFRASHPQLASQLTLDGEAVAIDATCSHVFVAAGSAGLHVVDISVPEAPVVVSSLPLRGDALSVAADGDRVLVGTRELLEVVDVSVLEAPFVRSFLQEAAPVIAVASASSWAFLGIEEPPGLLVADLSDPDRPITSTFLPEYGAVVAVEVGPHVLSWTALGPEHFYIADWCAPATLLFTAAVGNGECGPGCVPTRPQAVDVAMDADRAMVVYDDPAFGLQLATSCCF